MISTKSEGRRIGRWLTACAVKKSPRIEANVRRATRLAPRQHRRDDDQAKSSKKTTPPDQADKLDHSDESATTSSLIHLIHLIHPSSQYKYTSSRMDTTNKRLGKGGHTWHWTEARRFSSRDSTRFSGTCAGLA